MQESNFNTELRKAVASSIPCVHMNTMLIGERVLNMFTKYLESLKTQGLNTIDEVVAEMQKKNDTREI
jgi:hypothetical protein